MTKKKAAVENNDVTEIETAKIFHERFPRKIVDLPDMNDALSFALRITHTVTDRRAGSTGVEEVYGREPNLEIIAEAMKKDGARAEASRFFLEGRVTQVIENVIPVNTLKQGEAVAVRDAIIKGINGAVENSHAAQICAEFVVSLAYKTGIINETVKITAATVYAAKPVTTSDLSLDLVAQNAVRTAETIKVSMSQTEKMSKQSFARAFADALQTVGYELHRAVSIQHVFDDIVKAVRVRVLAGHELSNIGAIDQTWLENPVVTELMSNYTFVRAAINWPATSAISTHNDIQTLRNDAPIALASLKGSRRFAITSREEYLTTYGKKTILGIDGSPLYFVGWREASLQKVAQNISVFKDVLMPNFAVNVIPGPDNVSKFVAASSPSGDSASIGYHVNQLIGTLQHLAESNDPRLFAIQEGEQSVVTAGNIGETFVFGDDGQAFAEELAIFMAETCYLRPSEGVDAGFDLVYVVKTPHRRFNDLTWQVSLTAAGEFITDQIGLVFLMSDDIAPKSEVMPRAQLLSEKALYTRVVKLNMDDRVVKAKRRLGFSISLAGQNYKGAIATTDVGMQELPEDSYFVVPLHNSLITQMINSIQDSITEVIKDATAIATSPLDPDMEVDGAFVAISPATLEYLKHSQILSVLKMAQGISPQYRQVVTSLMRMRSLAGMSYGEAVRARGALYQQQFLAYADLISLALVLTTNGLEKNFVDNLLSLEQTVTVIMLNGSDRKEAIRA